MNWKNFSGIGGNGNRDDFGDAFDAFDNAPIESTEPIPVGRYEVDVLRGELKRAKSGTPLYRLSLAVRDGEHVGRKLWRDYFFTPAAASISKRELARMEITTREQMQTPLPLGLIALAVVGIEQDELTGEQRNVVKNLTKLRIDPPAADPFAPKGGPADVF